MFIFRTLLATIYEHFCSGPPLTKILSATLCKGTVQYTLYTSVTQAYENVLFENFQKLPEYSMKDMRQQVSPDAAFFWPSRSSSNR